MMDTNPSDTFQKLRPTCVKLSKEPSRSCVQELRDSLEHVESFHLFRLTEYVLFPLQLTLQRPEISNELKQDTVNCIEAILRKTQVEKLNIFDELFNLLSLQLSSKDAGKIAPDLSEELKLSIISCMISLFDSCGLIIRSVVYGSRYLASLGHTVSLLLAVAENDKARNLRIAALSCLRKISFCDECLFDNKPSGTASYTNGMLHQHEISATLHNKVEKHDMYMDIRDSAARTMAAFLPGIAIALSRIISGDPKQGHAVIMTSIETFGDVVAMVMSDRHLPCPDTDESDIMSALVKLTTKDSEGQRNCNTNDTSTLTDELSKKKNLTVNRTADWFQDTALKLKVLVEKITSASIGHSNWKVRCSVVNLCEKILVNCSESLSCCVSLLVDVLVGLLEDEYSEVSTKSRTVLECLSKQQHKKLQGKVSFTSVLEENLHAQLTALPRLMRTADDERKLRTLNLLNGYLELLNNRISGLLSSSAHLRRLSLAFIQVLELDISDVGIVEERTSVRHESAVIPSDTQGQNPISFPAENVTANQYPRYRFKHFTGDKIRVAISRSCQLLGCHGNLSLLVDHFLDLFHESKLHQKQAVFILNEILLGFALRQTGNHSTTTSSELQSAVKLLLAAYTSEKYWNLPTSNQNQPNLAATEGSTVMSHNPTNVLTVSSISYQNLNSNIQLTCLLLEGIGISAHVLGQTFDIFLIETLYPVLSKLGDDNAAVSRSAYGTLVLVCQSCGYSSVEELITQNADYLVNSIALDFKYVFVNEQAPRVLQVMIQYSNADIIIIIEDTLNDIFAVVDLYPDQLMVALMRVLRALVSSLYTWFVDEKKEQEATKQKQPNQSQHKEADDFGRRVTSFLQQYIKSKRIALGEVDDVSDDEDRIPDDSQSDDELDDPDDKPELPLHVKYTTQVLEKCIHFMSSSCPVLRILLLDTVYHGVLALRERENDLLPMVHRLWPPLIHRLADREQVVIIKAVTVITTMAECSGDFMRRRVIKDVLPKLLVFLEKQAQVSIKAGPVYAHSQAFKLQLASLDGLGRLCKQLNINELELDATARVSGLYLSSRQPLALQQAAVDACEKFIALEPDAMWLLLNNMYCRETLQPPGPMFREISLAGTKPECKEFALNVTLLLDKLDK